MTYEREKQFLKKGDRVLAAVSGGPDSVCLAHYLSQARRRRGFWLELLHVHHGLRPKDADRDAAFAQKLGEILGTPVTIVHAPVALQAAARGKGLEDAGRELRYRAFADCAKKLACNKVATAHQLDDQAETVLLHLMRGTRLKALAGIPPRRPLAPGIEVIRPLLPLTKKEVLEYLSLHGLKYRVDKSNFSLQFTRNWVRRKVLPLMETQNPKIREHLAGIAAQVQDLKL